MESKGMINSIVRAADILKVLSNGNMDRIADISDALQLSKSTTHRQLKTLEMTGFVRRDPITRRYFLGSLMVEIASKPILAHQNLIISSFDEMNYLRDYSGETVVLNIPIGVQRIVLEEVESNEDLKYKPGKGDIGPLYAGSAGKILLSEFKESELQILLKNIRLLPLGPNTITDKSVLLDELQKIRNQGYSISKSERLDGLVGISVPIKNYICPVALSIGGPENRIEPKMVDLIRELTKSAARIERNLL